MIARAGSGWYTVLADLALILFMVTAAVVAASPESEGVLTPSEQGEPLAWYGSGPDAPPLAEWLLAEGSDARQQLTITARYADGGMGRALAEAARLAEEAGRAGMRARIVVEPGPESVTAALAFDRPEAMLAQGLQQPER